MNTNSGNPEVPAVDAIEKEVVDIAVEIFSPGI